MKNKKLAIYEKTKVAKKLPQKEFSERRLSETYKTSKGTTSGIKEVKEKYLNRLKAKISDESLEVTDENSKILMTLIQLYFKSFQIKVCKHNDQPSNSGKDYDESCK